MVCGDGSCEEPFAGAFAGAFAGVFAGSAFAGAASLASAAASASAAGSSTGANGTAARSLATPFVFWATIARAASCDRPGSDVAEIVANAAPSKKGVTGDVESSAASAAAPS